MRRQPEYSHIFGLAYVLTYARTTVEIPHVNHPHLVDSFGQTPKIVSRRGILNGSHLIAHWQVSSKLFIDAPLHLGRLIFRQRTIEMVIALGFSRIDPGAEASPAVEHSNHDTIQNMLRRMHGSFISF